MPKSLKKERVIILLDGSNFYNRLKEQATNIKNLLKFDYAGLAQYLAEERKIVTKNYYVGRIREKEGDMKAKQLRANQNRLIAHLRSPKQRWSIFFGYIMNVDGKYHEKGVDVKIAVDMLAGAYENQYDVVILISSDTDLLPAMQKVKELGKKIEYVGFGHKPSFGMQHNADISRLLIKSELERFCQVKNRRK